MTDTGHDRKRAVRPAAPEMAAADPAMFAPLTSDENRVLSAHLISGWTKQSAVYPVLSEPWRETTAVLDDIHAAWQLRWDAEHQPEAGQ